MDFAILSEGKRKAGTMKGTILSLVLFITVFGCASEPRYVWESETSPFWHEIKNEYYSAVISVIQADTGYEGFLLTIRNRSSQELTIDWSETRFLKNGIADGGFVFEGMPPKDHDRVRPLDTIRPGSVLTEILYPASLASYSGEWHHKLLPDGINSVHLAIRFGQYEMGETKDFVMRSVEVRQKPQPDETVWRGGMGTLP